MKTHTTLKKNSTLPSVLINLKHKQQNWQPINSL